MSGAQLYNGGPAFPRQLGTFDKGAEGMSVRDYFAAQAMVAMLPIYAGMNGGDQNGIGTDHIVRNVSAHAYRMADAMLAERTR